MTLEEIASALKSSRKAIVPVDAIKAGVAKADELAPIVFALVDKLCSGVYLIPEDNALLFYGLHILAAARHPDLFPCLMKLAHEFEDELEQLFPHYISTGLTRLLLSVWNGDADAHFEAIEHGNFITDVTWALFEVLARLTFEQRIPRDRTIAFLGRLESEGLIEDGDLAWWGWEEAVTRLGITELEPALRRVWSKVIFDQHAEVDHADSLSELCRAATDPNDASIFDERHSLHRRPRRSRRVG